MHDIIVILVIYILLLTLHIEMYSYINKKICNVLYYIVIFNNFGKIRLFFDFEIPCQTDRESSDKGSTILLLVKVENLEYF